ncbi:hypothetical protein Q427_24110 [Halomonas sp. BC04]|nr:hypothetical protein Q427_24110 [Halomonas sp. BC04]
MPGIAPGERGLPQPLLAEEGDLPSPLADFMLVLTDRPPARVREVSPTAITGSLALQRALEERVEEAPYLPDLEGVSVSRVAEGSSFASRTNGSFPPPRPS